MNEPQHEYGALVANWNGADIIERCLKSVMGAAQRAEPPIKVTVVDDASADGSADLIECRFPEARLLRLEKNVGFGKAVNHGVAALDTPWVFLLNNDLVLPADYFQSLIAAKEAVNAATLFAIGSRTLEWGSEESNHAGMRAGWRRAMISQVPFETNRLEKADFVQMGSCLVHREKFQQMGGFAEIYSPGYWEDYDLSYQARRLGWENYYEPHAYAYHWGKRSMAARLGADGLALVMKRNHLLFNWVNLADRGLLIKHLASLGPLALSPDVKNGASSVGWGRALLAALALLPEALRLRRRRRDNASVADREILFATEQ